MNHPSKPTEEVIAAIQALDLDPIKVKLMHPEEGYGWSREFAERMEIAYKRFLTLLVKHPDEVIAPTKDVDKFWHGHILDTLKYAEDCRSVFGYFLHHFPYLGMRGAEDTDMHRAASANMHRLYEAEFGERIAGVAAERSARAAGAFCYAAKSAAAPEGAFCYATKPAAVSESAFCYASQPPAQSDGAFCYTAKPAHSGPDVTVRPRLPAAG